MCRNNAHPHSHEGCRRTCNGHHAVPADVPPMINLFLRRVAFAVHAACQASQRYVSLEMSVADGQ